ncbi:MAG: hypothetical protein MK135_04740 [Polyangiaceae bacterium]|nr:hypothetical protein [Polyangiaceae bacterium]
MVARPTWTPTDLEFPQLIQRAWNDYGDPRTISTIQEISADVSTNRVYLIKLNTGFEIVAKTSTYGSYVHFRQDHRIIQQWIRRLANSRFRSFLAGMLQKDHEVFTWREGNIWVVFYEKTQFYDFLPQRLNPDQVSALGTEMASFHQASATVAPLLNTSWKSLGSDIAALYDAIGNQSWREERNFSKEAESIVRTQCDTFLIQAEKLGYHQLLKLPVLIDWNIGNFSVGLEEQGFKFFSRWDYDWFRVEPRVLDFHFCARVVRSEGDQAQFSYTVAPYFEERFIEFLRAYDRVNPLADEEILFLKEVYRFFILNYVLRQGEHFFRPEFCHRLQREALHDYFPALEATDFHQLLRAVRK